MDQGGFCCGGTGAHNAGAPCQVDDSVCLANHTEADGSFDFWLLYEHKYMQIVDVAALTKNGPVTLTLNGTASGATFSWPFEIDVQVFGDARFVMTQTPSDFRPLDSRDTASHCPTFNPTGGATDNCHPTFCAWLSLGDGGGSACNPVILPELRQANRLRPGPKVLFPNVAADPSAFSATFDFTLSRTKDSTGKVKPWLAGTSTNFTPPQCKAGTVPGPGNYCINRRNPGENAAAPDYLFEQGTPPEVTQPINANLAAPSSDGLSIGTAAAIDPLGGVLLTVTSHDFGGSAWLRAKATMLGKTYDVDIVDPNTGQNVFAPSDSAVGNCGTEFTNRPFAALPVDQNCNGIADGWESQYGGNLDASADSDSVGQNANSGDGFSTFDEYRGFHVLDPGGATSWLATDPTKRDLFYWDPNNIIANLNNATSTNHLAAIFGEQTASFITLHRVSAQQAHANTPKNPGKGVTALNSASPTAPKGFALIYQKSSLPGSTLGQSGLDSDPTNSFQNTGVLPIQLDTGKAKQFASENRQTDQGGYATVILNQALAHETGHKLGREHRTRTAARIGFDQSHIKNLHLEEFMQDPNTPANLYVDEIVYNITTKEGFNRNETLTQESVPCGSNSTGVFNTLPATQVPYPIGSAPKPPEGQFQVTVSSTVFDQITVVAQDGTIMSWTPKLRNIRNNQWTFAPEDLAGMCLSPLGCGVVHPVNCHVSQ